MKTLRNLKENSSGLVDCEILLGEEWHDHSIESHEEYEIHESSEWPDIKPLPQAEKDAHAAQEARDSILSELSALDFPIHKIERALAGDQQAIDDIKTNEIKKNELRKKLGQV